MQDVFRAAGQAAWTEILPADVLSALTPPDRWRDAIELELPEGEVWVAGAGPVTMGFAVLRRSSDDDAASDTGEIDSFYTHPTGWGSGVGRAIMERALQRLFGSGHDEVTLWTEERNYRPRRFYEQSGFELDGAIRERELRDVALRELRYRIAK